jgi:broad specificity phosphatase PhoE
MIITMRARWMVVPVLLLSLAAVAQEHRAPTTVVLVRHSEKAAPTGDPPLAAAGVERAKELARVLADANVQVIYVTEFLRTQQTAEPLTTALGVKPVVVETGAKYAAQMADLVRRHPGETLLIVGHSNTIGEVMRQLGIANPPTIADTEYDDLFICTVGDGPARLMRLRYGAPAR